MLCLTTKIPLQKTALRLGYGIKSIKLGAIVHITDRRRFFALSVSAVALALVAQPVLAEASNPVDDTAILDALIERFMTRFEVPGAAIAILRPEKPDYIKGFGVRRLGQAEKVDINTQFGVASNTKAFTCAALAILAEEKKLELDAPVITYIPEFKMSDPKLTKLVSVRDLVIHRAGLPLGAGDLMLFPQSDHTRQDILKGIQYLKPSYPFRSGADYVNTPYAVAGIVIERVTGQAFEAFITERLLRPLGMTQAVMGQSRIVSSNVAGRHARLGPPLRGIGAVKPILPEETDAFGPAAGLIVSVSEIRPWLRLQLNKGVLPSGQRLWSEATAKEMWRPQTIFGSSSGPTPELPTTAMFRTYGLGWFIQDYRGKRLVSHSGGLAGQVTQQALLPDQGIAIAVYTNTEDNTAAFIRNALLDYCLGVSGFDWVDVGQKRVKESQEQAIKDIPKPEVGGPSLPLKAYAGRYRDAWYGDVVINLNERGLSIDFTRTPRIKGPMETFGPDKFRTRIREDWGEDMIISFDIKKGRVKGIKLKAYSPLADFSFDYHNLDLKKIS
jgi:CubicO group peptidase (beta-lactamase class C family)